MSKPKTARQPAKADRRRAAPTPKKKLAAAAIKSHQSKKQPTSVAKVLPPASAPGAPGGKLGAIIAAISTEAGATLSELAAKTGWLPHTTRAALCRLRQRGFAVNLGVQDGRKAYRLAARA